MLLLDTSLHLPYLHAFHSRFFPNTRLNVILRGSTTFIPYLSLHVEPKEDESSLQAIEDREDVPAEGEVGEGRNEPRHPRHALDHRQLHVQDQTQPILLALASLKSDTNPLLPVRHRLSSLVNVLSMP